MDSVIPVRNIHINMGIILSGNQLREQEQRCGFWKQADSLNICQAPFLAELCWMQGANRQERRAPLCPPRVAPLHMPNSEMHSPNRNLPGVFRVSTDRGASKTIEHGCLLLQGEDTTFTYTDTVSVVIYRHAEKLCWVNEGERLAKLNGCTPGCECIMVAGIRPWLKEYLAVEV